MEQPDEKDWRDELKRKYPLLFPEKLFIGVGDGWKEILFDAASKIEPLIQTLVDDNIDKDFLPRACQVKEKFGGLRLYMTSTTDEIEQIIDESERLSKITCELCGAPGSMRKGGWMTCLCDKHASN